MTKVRIHIVLVLTICTLYKATGQHIEESFAVSADYLVSAPTDYDQNDDHKWPVMIFLHGGGDYSIERVKQDFVPVFVSKYVEFPMLVVTPVSNGSESWNIYMLNKLLDDVLEKYDVDENRIYLTGHSMGGNGTWDWATNNPERFAAIAPIAGCPAGEDAIMAWRLRTLPTWIFHGDQDQLVDVSCSERAYEGLKKINQAVKLTIYPNTGHETWEQPFAVDSVFSWMLKHSREKNKPLPISLDKNISDRYLGQYLYYGDTLSIHYKDDKLFGSNQQGDQVALIPVSETSFYLEPKPNVGMIFRIENEKVTGFDVIEDQKTFVRKIY